MLCSRTPAQVFSVVLVLTQVACDDRLYGSPIDDDALVYTPDWDGVSAFTADHCEFCHSPGGSAEFLPLPDALAWDLQDGTGRYVVPFEPAESRFWRSISGNTIQGDLAMPPGTALSDSQVDHVRLWILDGAPAPTLDQDQDGDGFGPGDGDCDDSDPTVNPSVPEVCDGIDNDCDGTIDGPLSEDAVTVYPDADGDTYGDQAAGETTCAPATGWIGLGGDCDDSDATVHPGATELDCRDPVDRNCDGTAFGVDADADGSFACDDCDDTDASIFPGADELCDGIDQDCDGTADEGAIDPTLFYPDLDGDGFGDGYVGGTAACTAPGPTWIDDNSDCNDASAAVSPLASEVCDGQDNDCNGLVDDAAIDPQTWYFDGDGDGFGDDAVSVQACTAPAGHVAVGGDCDDADPAYNPGAVETDCLDPNDYNCDGSVGAVDGDGDGYFACEECDDTDAAVSPGATEVCDGVDNDCSGAVDDGAIDAGLWFEDADGDGFGNDTVPGVLSCGPPALGWTQSGGDCDDSNGLVNTSGVEICDGADNDCDGTVDQGAIDALAWYADGDGDGEGAGAPVFDCATTWPGHALTDTDCDDGDAAVNSSAAEVCDGVDNDCSGLADDDAVDANTWYADADGDGHGDQLDPGFLDCSGAVPGASLDNTDCNDANAAISPSADEVCDGLVDEDCSGFVDDDAVDAIDWYTDADGDGYGDPLATPTAACTAPAGTSADPTDCDDSDATVNPGLVYDFQNGVDDDCDGTVDEDGSLPSAAADIQPIFDAYCTPLCHEPPAPSGNLDLTNGFAATVNVPSDDVPTMDRVEPFDTANSYLWHKLQGTQLSVGGAGNQMPAASPGPPGPQITAQEIALIESWILTGALP